MVSHDVVIMHLVASHLLGVGNATKNSHSDATFLFDVV